MPDAVNAIAFGGPGVWLAEHELRLRRHACNAIRPLVGRDLKQHAGQACGPTSVLASNYSRSIRDGSQSCGVHGWGRDRARCVCRRRDVVTWSNIANTQPQWISRLAANDHERIFTGVERGSDVTIHRRGVRNVCRNFALVFARCSDYLRVSENGVQAAGLVVNAKFASMRRLLQVRLRPLPAQAQPDKILLLELRQIPVPTRVVEPGPPLSVNRVPNHSRIRGVESESLSSSWRRRGGLRKQTYRGWMNHRSARRIDVIPRAWFRRWSPLAPNTCDAVGRVTSKNIDAAYLITVPTIAQRIVECMQRERRPVRRRLERVSGINNQHGPILCDQIEASRRARRCAVSKVGTPHVIHDGASGKKHSELGLVQVPA